MVETFDAVFVALVYRVNADESRSTLWSGGTARANGDGFRVCLGTRPVAARGAVGSPFAQVVEM